MIAANTTLDILNGVLEHCFEAVVTVDQDGQIVFFNAAAEHLFGYAAEDILHESLETLVPPRYRGRHDGFLKAFAESPEESQVMGRNGEIPACRRDMSEFVAEGTISKLRSGNGLYFTAVLRDATERQAATKRVEASEQKHRAIVDSAPDAILIANSDTGLIKEVNAAACKMFGCTAETLVGLHQEMLHPAESRAAYRQRFREHVDEGRVRVPDAEIQRADGTALPVSISARPTQIAGEPVLVGFFRDIRERKEHERELAAARDAAEAANRAKSDFLASMSHELRTPLNGILGFTDMLRCQLHGPLGHDRYGDYANNIHASGQYLLQTIEEILDFSRLDSGKYPLTESRFPLSAAVNECLDMVRAAAEQGDLSLSADLPADLPDLYADRHAVKQVLMNLLSNAVKFTHRGGRITVTATVQPDGWLRLAVVDTGIGIAPEVRETVFDRFEQGPSAKFAARKGTGLGLTVAKRLMALHGGDLTLDGAVGVGTTATALFPAERLAASPGA